VKKNFFTENDFNNLTFESKYHASDRANEKLTEYLESCPVIYTDKDLLSLCFTSEVGLTHRARLAFIEEIPKTPYQHEPFYERKMFDDPKNIKCKKCGVKLVAEWKEKSEAEKHYSLLVTKKISFIFSLKD